MGKTSKYKKMAPVNGDTVLWVTVLCPSLVLLNVGRTKSVKMYARGALLHNRDCMKTVQLSFTLDFFFFRSARHKTRRLHIQINSETNAPVEQARRCAGPFLCTGSPSASSFDILVQRQVTH